MKHQILIIAIVLISNLGMSQEKNIETKSVSVDNFISFVIENIERKVEDSTAPSEHITFLIQTPINDLLIEDKVVLKQAFKLISKRLTEGDQLTIIAYSGFNGIALQKTSAKDVKGILYAVDNLKRSVKEFHKDGIDLAYNYAKDNFEEEANNTVVMIRNPNLENTSQAAVHQAKTPKVKNNTVLITAIALLPEIITLIKD